MRTVVGIFTSQTDAERAVEQLRAVGLTEHVNLLTPCADAGDLQTVPTTQTEQPGMGKALGGVVGGAAGIAAGSHLGSVLATALVPGVGPVIAVGIAAAALLGIGGAVGGAAAGGAVENALATGLPQDELFVYEDALRKGRTVVIVLAEDGDRAEAARGVLDRAGAESLDAARQQWWIGLRSAEEEAYTVQGGDFRRDETEYQCGFEAALHQRTRGKSYGEAAAYLRQRYPDLYQKDSFRRGYERGQTYYRDLLDRRERSSG
jgi:hypothetical protein